MDPRRGRLVLGGVHKPWVSVSCVPEMGGTAESWPRGSKEGAGTAWFQTVQSGPVLPERSPEPRCSIFFTALGFLICLVIKFPGLQQVRRGCCSWKQAQGPGEAMESSSRREASAGREEPWKGQASCLSGTAALAPAIVHSGPVQRISESRN